MVATSSGCLLRPNPNSSARLRLVCFPYAGGGVSAFAGWHKTLPSDVEVGYVQLAGRDGRRREAPVSDFRALIDDLTQTLSWNDDIPVAFFGVSMGGLVSFELAREFRRRALPLPVHLFICAHRAPQLRVLNAGERPLHLLPDEEFIGELERRYGPAPDFSQNRELVELLLPLLRVDLAACESYVYRTEEPLSCSISAFGGTDDRRVRMRHLEPWHMHTTGTFDLRVFPGDHFFARNDPRPLLQVLNRELDRLLGLPTC